MLDSFIIEELRRRKEREQSDYRRPALELPIYDGRGYQPVETPKEKSEDHDSDRGVIIIDI